MWHQGFVVSCKQQKALPMFTKKGHAVLQTHRKGSPQAGGQGRGWLRGAGGGRSPSPALCLQWARLLEQITFSWVVPKQEFTAHSCVG